MAIMPDDEADVINIEPRKYKQHKQRTGSNSSHESHASNAPLETVQTASSANTTTPLVANSPPLPKPASYALNENNLSLFQGIRQYPKAVTWSVLISLTLIMEGYSTILIPNLFALAPFKQQFGSLQPSGAYEVSAAWQSALVNGGLAGQILGLFAAGTLAEKIGYRRTLMVGLWLMTAFIFVPFFAKGKMVLLVGQCLMGAPWGLFQCISTVYAADVCPVGLRSYLTTYVNACWVLGQLLASMVLRSTLSFPTQWSYRIPFALQWIFPLPILIAVYYAPESPWWLIRNSHVDNAKHNLRRLRTKPPGMDAEAFEKLLDEALREIQETNEKERVAQSGTRYVDCFRGTDRRRTEIACMCWVVQTLCGSGFMGFSTYFYEQAGLPSSHAFTLSLAQFSLGLLGVIISWVLMSYYGRRTLYLSGQALTFLFVLLIGVLSCVPQPPLTTPSSSFAGGVTGRSVIKSQPNALNWTTASLLLAFTLIYDATLGPICYALVSEIPSTRLKSKTIVLARNCYNISGIVTNIITPRMLNPTAWGWGAKAGFFWAGTAALGIAWSWWRLPEPRGRGYGELDELFRRGVKAREFGGYVLEEGGGRGGEGEGEKEKLWV